jgi:tetratricopeptide (TPR) repeat protein
MISIDHLPAPDPPRSRRAAIGALNESGNQAFATGRMAEARAAYQHVIELLTPADEEISPLAFENLGLAYYNLDQYPAATRELLRALNGNPSSREQSLCFLITSLIHQGCLSDALRYLSLYIPTFGEHPHGWTSSMLRTRAEDRRIRLSRLLVS